MDAREVTSRLEQVMSSVEVLQDDSYEVLDALYYVHG